MVLILFFSDGILQFVDHHIAAYIWQLCPHSWWVHPAYRLAGPAFIFLKFSPDLLSKPYRKYFYLCSFLMNWFLKLHCLKFPYSVCECHKSLLPAQPTHIRFVFFQSVLTSSWAIIIIQTKCCGESDNIADLGLFGVVLLGNRRYSQEFEYSNYWNLEELWNFSAPVACPHPCSSKKVEWRVMLCSNYFKLFLLKLQDSFRKCEVYSEKLDLLRKDWAQDKTWIWIRISKNVFRYFSM